ncbi:integral membrane sensor domain MASE1 [Streptomyces sp. SAI-208]|jgi:integral membrane sensor domain MASE1|uniref:MASE1 domain-containing protein n=1 Tax=unclassified Streptomyces TaxID=2593676 RepID=UPI002474B3D5|nr:MULTISPECIES: MASE1 domain-containing protein [unclassified Streptomyces]MDH6546422.1 integral membrane sensor domain MASE1 [Streptomyces sp. SAI-041]MDH6565520.1 integral membrane sensor domain MASE1 [Streptomyces sp. SAI-117]MDH6589561.1 integral membrane sensor domain MASE1 [Streptomyces sp. SAI-133]MDH6605083.1 integral membrane sensor domain MASE1 [Streptomyces sp. SAI-208]
MASVVGTENLRRTGVLALQTLAVAGSYYAAGRLGLLWDLTVEGAVFTPIWPPTGIAVASLLIFGLSVWPGIALGALLVIVHLTSSLEPDVLGNLAGNTAAPICAYLMLRAVGFRTGLSRLRDGMALVFLGALTGMLISSTVGVGMLVMADRLQSHSFWGVWLAWWVGDAMGVLIVTPLLLWLYESQWPPQLSRWPEATALIVVTGAVVPLVTHSSLSVLFLVYPLLIWAALRFQLIGSMLCALATSVVATVAAREEAGPFEGLSRVEVMIKLQAFNGTIALTALLLSAVITEQRNTRRSVEAACHELVEVLEHLTAGDAPRGRPVQSEGEADGGPPQQETGR